MRSSKLVIGLLLVSSAALADGGKWAERKQKMEACLTGKGVTSQQLASIESCFKQVHDQRPDGRDAFKAAMDSCLSDSLKDAYNDQLKATLKDCRPHHKKHD